MAAVAVAGIGDVIDAARWRLDDEGRRQRLVAVKQMARCRVRHRRERDGNARTKLDAIARIVGLDADRRVVVAHDRVVTERRDDAASMRGRESRQSRDIEMVVMAIDTSTASIGGSASNATPGSFTRFCPMKANGEARSDHKGSVRMFMPAVCSRTVACPTNEIRHAAPAIRGGGWSDKGLVPMPAIGLAAAGVPAQQLCTLFGGEPVDRKTASRRSDPTPGRRSSAPSRSECQYCRIRAVARAARAVNMRRRATSICGALRRGFSRMNPEWARKLRNYRGRSFLYRSKPRRVAALCRPARYEAKSLLDHFRPAPRPRRGSVAMDATKRRPDAIFDVVIKGWLFPLAFVPLAIFGANPCTVRDCLDCLGSLTLPLTLLLGRRRR